jgi:hypothetical protein
MSTSPASRLEEVVIVPVHQHHIDVGAPKRLGGRDAYEPSTDTEHAATSGHAFGHKIRLTQGSDVPPLRGLQTSCDQRDQLPASPPDAATHGPPQFTRLVQGH